MSINDSPQAIPSDTDPWQRYFLAASYASHCLAEALIDEHHLPPDFLPKFNACFAAQLTLVPIVPPSGGLGGPSQPQEAAP